MLLHDFIFKEGSLKSTTVVYFPSDKENDERVGYDCFKGYIVRLCSGQQEKVLDVLC